MPQPPKVKNAGAPPPSPRAENSPTVLIPPVRWTTSAAPVQPQRLGVMQPRCPEASIPPVRFLQASGAGPQRVPSASIPGTPSNAIPPVRIAGTNQPVQPKIAGAGQPPRAAAPIPPVRLPGASGGIQLHRTSLGEGNPVTHTGQPHPSTQREASFRPNHRVTGAALGEKGRLNFLSTTIQRARRSYVDMDEDTESYSDPEDNNPAPEELKGKKIGKRTGGSAPYFKSTYKPHKGNLFYQGRTTSDLGDQFECYYCDQPVIVEVAEKTERGLLIGKNNPRSQKPPVAHPAEYPAAHVIAALNELLREKKKIVPDNALPGYMGLKQTVEWEFPQKMAGLYCAHTSCNSAAKDVRWDNLSKKKRETMKKELHAYLEKMHLYDLLS